MRIDSTMDTLIVGMGVALVVVGVFGAREALSVLWVHTPAPWWKYAEWFLVSGLAICLLCLWLGHRGAGGFTSLPAIAGSCLGTLLAVIMGARLLLNEVRLRRGVVCETVVQSVQYTPTRHAQKPYLITTKIQKIISGNAHPDHLIFRVQSKEEMRVGTIHRFRYRKLRHPTNLKALFRRRMKETLDDFISVTVPQGGW